MKGLYIILTGSKTAIAENEKAIEEFLKTFKRKVGNNQVSCAKISRELLMDTEHNSMSTYKLSDFPKIDWYLKAYKAVILKYRHHGKTVHLHTRGRRWRINKKGKEVYDLHCKED